MIRVCSLNIPKIEGLQPWQVLQLAMEKSGVSWDNVALVTDRWLTTTRYSGWRVTPVKYTDATVELSKALTALGEEQDTLDVFPITVLEPGDITSFKPGDKVKIIFTSRTYGLPARVEGRVYYVNQGAKELGILKKWAKEKGWAFHAGDMVTVERIERYSKKGVINEVAC